MSVTCPKCRYVRQISDAAPDWQCPGCGVAYAKANTVPDAAHAARASGAAAAQPSKPFPWAKGLLIAALVFGAWQGMQVSRQHRGGIASTGADISGDASAAELTQLAATVGPQDVTIYTTTGCPYCAEAKAWMTQYGFAYAECDAEVRSECAQQLQEYGSTGVPYLVVRGHHMKDGFDSDEFVAALRQGDPASH
jgi:glutaredoxin